MADPRGFGEGQTYLTTLTEGSGADADTGNYLRFSPRSPRLCVKKALIPRPAKLYAFTAAIAACSVAIAGTS